MITLTQREWSRIRKQIAVEWPPSVLLLRSVMKRELGFTDRTHQKWDEREGYITTIYLDFFDDAKEIWFRLKYLNND